MACVYITLHIRAHLCVNITLHYGGSVMDTISRIEQNLIHAVTLAQSDDCPAKLSEAIEYTVFSGGARIRPQLCLAVALACKDDRPEVANAAAIAIELLHCASLVHDDLPCFDNAATRRGKPSVHRAFGEPLAVLTGDALIVLAFQLLSRQCAAEPDRLVTLLRIISDAVGAPNGICAGQAWESEPTVSLRKYQRAKTGALFAAATMAGAAASGHDAKVWRMLGECIGEAYQVADDIRDVAGDPEKMGKPVGQDEALDRPSACQELGLPGAIKRFKSLMQQAVDSIPDCAGAEALKAHMLKESERFLPKEIIRNAA